MKICTQCGNTQSDEARVCDACGALFKPERKPDGLQGMRQGRVNDYGAERTSSTGGRAVPNADYAQRSPHEKVRSRRYEQDAGRPTMRRGVPDKPKGEAKAARRRKNVLHPVKKHMINWTKVWLCVAVVLVACVGAGLLYLQHTDQGQLIMARMGRESNDTAKWTLGTEYLNQGYIDRAIATYQAAYEQNPDREDIFEKLQLLAEAYEAGGRAGDAEEVYTKLYEEIDEKSKVGYDNRLRLMLAQGRTLEATELMSLAYEKTGDGSYKSRREQLLPPAPTSSIGAGSHAKEISVDLLSAGGYEIYYTLGEGELPETGTLYTEPLYLKEGVYTIRAVCVSSDLVSDEVSLKYRVTLPSPVAPTATLASGTYETKRRVWLRYADKDPVTIYYTIDSTYPTIDSPIYDGEPIWLNAGKMTLRAVTVNSYGKVSNELNLTYQINRPFKNYYRTDKDNFSDFTTLSTTYETFVKRMGSPQSEAEITDENVKGSCTSVQYAWGEARFVLTEKGRQIYYFRTTGNHQGPRKTKVGMSAENVIASFRDMGQVANARGNRSLYNDAAVGYGKYTKTDESGAEIEYAYYAQDGATVTLTYQLKNDKVAQIELSYSLK